MGGGASDATKQQQQLNLQATQQQMAFNTQLMALFSKQYANQQNILKYLQSITKPIVAQSLKGQGMSTAALNAMRTSATDTISSQFQSAQQALNAIEAGQMGGTNVLPSGTRAQLTAGLLANETQTKAGTQNQITQYNQSLANSNLWNALGVIGGTGATMNPLGYASSATGGSEAVAGLGNSQSNLQNAITQANASGFWGSFTRGFGSALGGTLGGGNLSFSHAF